MPTATTTTPQAPPVVDPIHEAEKADAAKTADDAPAPVHSDAEREVIVRDAHGREPHGADTYGPDGRPDNVQLGQPPEQAPDPIAGALRDAAPSPKR